jgi:hypothetical protein
MDESSGENGIPSIFIVEDKKIILIDTPVGSILSFLKF